MSRSGQSVNAMVKPRSQGSIVICVSAQITSDPTDDQFEAASATLKLLSDTTRLRILWALLHGEHSVNELAEHVGALPTTVSQHLAKLRLAKLVRVRRQGTQMFYVVENDHLERLTTEALFHADHVTGVDHHTTPAQAHVAPPRGRNRKAAG